MNIVNQIINANLNYSYPVIFTGTRISALSQNYSFENMKFNKMKPLLEELLQFDPSPLTLHKELSTCSFPIITESFDGLHKAAGSKNVIELHGDLNKIICSNCDYFCNISYLKSMYNFSKEFNCPQCNSLLRPDIVLLGESVRDFHLALNEIYKSDLLIVIGSHLKNWPANKIVSKALNNGTKLLTINAS